jgi:hypothetical protein
MCVPSDEDFLVLAALLAYRNKRFVFICIRVPYIITITVTLHCCEANTSLFQEEMGKEIDA